MVKRTDVLNALKTELQRIDGSVDTRVVKNAPYQYKKNVHGNVFSRYKYWDNINDFPAICFAVRNEQRQHIGAGIKYVILTIMLRGYVKEEDSLGASEDLGEDIEFIITQLKDSVGCANDIVSAKIIRFSTDEGLFAPRGVCQFDLEIIYQQDFGI